MILTQLQEIGQGGGGDCHWLWARWRVRHPTLGIISPNVLNFRVGQTPPIDQPSPDPANADLGSQDLSESDFRSELPWKGPPRSQPGSGSKNGLSSKAGFLCLPTVCCILFLVHSGSQFATGPRNQTYGDSMSHSGRVTQPL